MKRILFVDDNDSFRNAFARIIEKPGYRVTEAVDGKAGLLRFQAETPDLVICDLIMPEVEGMQTIQKMLHRQPGIRFIAIAGGGRINPLDYLRLAEKLGVAGTVSKPFSTDELLSAIERAIGPGSPAVSPVGRMEFQDN